MAVEAVRGAVHDRGDASLGMGGVAVTEVSLGDEYDVGVLGRPQSRDQSRQAAADDQAVALDLVHVAIIGYPGALGGVMRGAQGLRESIPGWAPPSRRSSYTLGVFRGEGIGAEVIEACLQILDAATKNTDVSFSIRQSGPIGKQALCEQRPILTRDVIDFCQSVFAQEGAVLCGPGGGRFVYDLRKALDLYCKLTPIIPIPVVGDAGVIKPETRRDVDIMVVREIASGEYLGRWEEVGEGRDRSAIHHFS
ncbi:MAG: isocitrate/isopropylmalate family dehydrogenase, partial [Phycisphaerales bacterium]|nr:isocitrate/isopropylmalate family dehydrogenase [Phycisphaerales bacterium]